MYGIEQRSNQILTAVDNLLRVHDEWEADDSAPVQPTEAFEVAIMQAVETADTGDVPSECRDLCTALSILGLEWDKYAGKNCPPMRTPDHRPISSFWGAYRNVVTARERAQPQALKQPEPVFLLLEQKVPDHQIAFHIWGFNGKGPFVTPAGQVDSAKIREEGKEAGKYTANWVHPEQLIRQQERQKTLNRRLSATSQRETRDIPTERATVVEMLKEGQYPDVIANVKGLSLETVLDEAKRFSITPNIRPNLAAMRAPQEPGIFGATKVNESEIQSAMEQVSLSTLADVLGADETSGEADEFGGVEIDQDEDASSGAGDGPQVSIADLIRSFADGKRGNPEIRDAVLEASGKKVSFQQINNALKVAKAS